MELEVKNYKTYGDPHANRLVTPLGVVDRIETPAVAPAAAPAPAEAKSPLKWDKEATLAWYFKNTPVGTLVSAAGIVIGVFVAGVGVGNWQSKNLASQSEVKAAVASDVAKPATPETNAASAPAP